MSNEEGELYKIRLNINQLCQIQSQQGSWRGGGEEQTVQIIFKNNPHILTFYSCLSLD